MIDQDNTQPLQNKVILKFFYIIRKTILVRPLVEHDLSFTSIYIRDLVALSRQMHVRDIAKIVELRLCSIKDRV